VPEQEDFHINKKGYKITATERECTTCGKMFPLMKKTGTCKECRSKIHYAIPANVRMHARAKHRAKEMNREFDLEPSDITIPNFCPILGIKLEASGTSVLTAPSLDRIDNSKGYVKGNVQVISMMANQMKSSASPEQLYKFAKWIMLNYSENGFATR
jgi:hypothetical protein